MSPADGPECYQVPERLLTGRKYFKDLIEGLASKGNIQSESACLLQKVW